ncbi:MAG TPA: hypothetical protein VEA69_03245 [Tepidisphaeraceae bacterium]|nr:hypothetical protein [Tepidisphaeraceae bacterium]
MFINAVSSYPPVGPGHTYRSTWAYRELYYGLDDAVMNRYGERPYHALPIMPNARVMPAVTFASVWMVVEQAIADAWRAVPHVDLNPCELRAAYDVPMDEASVTKLYERFSALDEEFSGWIRKQCGRVPRSLRDRKYSQVIVPSLTKLAASFPGRTQFELPSRPGWPLPGFVTSAELHTAYPIVYAGPHYLLDDATFGAIAHAVADPEVFFVRRIEVE